MTERTEFKNIYLYIKQIKVLTPPILTFLLKKDKLTPNKIPETPVNI